MTVVGPEAALAAGVVDALAAKGHKAFGPTKAAARIESSKEFAKHIMEKYNVLTAGYEAFDNFEQAWDYVKGRPLPTVIKYDGLTAEKAWSWLLRMKRQKRLFATCFSTQASGRDASW